MQMKLDVIDKSEAPGGSGRGAPLVDYDAIAKICANGKAVKLTVPKEQRPHIRKMRANIYQSMRQRGPHSVTTRDGCIYISRRDA